MTRKWIPIAAALLFFVPVTVARQEEKQSREERSHGIPFRKRSWVNVNPSTVL